MRGLFSGHKKFIETTLLKWFNGDKKLRVEEYKG